MFFGCIIATAFTVIFFGLQSAEIFEYKVQEGGDHADGSHDFGEITSWDNSWWLVIDTALEASGAPVDELDGSLGLDGGNGGVDVLGDNVTSVHHAAGHVLAVSGVAFGHHGGGLESGVGDLGDGELLVVSFLGRDDGGVWLSRVQPPEPRHAIGLFQFTSSARKSLKPIVVVAVAHSAYCAWVHGLCLKVRQSVA